MLQIPVAIPGNASQQGVSTVTVNENEMEEGMGFEPTKGVTLYTLSKRAPSTTRTPLQLNEM